MDIANHMPFIIGAWLFIVGMYGIATSKNLVHLIVCFNVLQASTYLLIISIGYRYSASAPIYNEIPAGTRAVDPVSHALILTDLVVGTTVAALLLSIAVQIYKRKGTLDPNEMSPLRE